MTIEEEYEKLKKNITTTYTSYANIVEKYSFQEIKDFKVRSEIMGCYLSSVKANTEYRAFIAKHAFKKPGD